MDYVEVLFFGNLQGLFYMKIPCLAEYGYYRGFSFQRAFRSHPSQAFSLACEYSRRRQARSSPAAAFWTFLKYSMSLGFEPAILPLYNALQLIEFFCDPELCPQQKKMSRTGPSLKSCRISRCFSYFHFIRMPHLIWPDQSLVQDPDGQFGKLQIYHTGDFISEVLIIMILMLWSAGL